jgi:TetR/AcrR family transcriptional repressor of bet genes
MNERSFICNDFILMQQAIDTSQPKRSLSKARNRQLLISTTLDVVAEFGIAGVSFTRVLERAGLSRGMINLHFENKEQLLLAAARTMAENYYDHLQGFVSDIEDDAEGQLIALLAADFDDHILNPREIGVWFAFRGEARYNAEFKPYSNTRDQHLMQLYDKIFGELLARGQPGPIKPRDLTLGLLALTEGLWSDFFMHAENFNRNQSRRIIYLYLSSLLPHCQRIAALV